MKSNSSSGKREQRKAPHCATAPPHVQTAASNYFLSTSATFCRFSTAQLTENFTIEIILLLKQQIHTDIPSLWNIKILYKASALLFSCQT